MNDVFIAFTGKDLVPAGTPDPGTVKHCNISTAYGSIVLIVLHNQQNSPGSFYTDRKYYTIKDIFKH